MLNIFVVNIKASTDRRESVMNSLIENECSVADIEIVHPLMVRDFPSQDDWCEATGMEAFKRLKGRPPLQMHSFLHTYLRILGKIENFPDISDFGLILEDDFMLNTEFSNIKRYLNILWTKRKSNSLFVQLASWKRKKDSDVDKSKRVRDTPFYSQALNGTNSNVFSKIAANRLKTMLIEEIPIRYSMHDTFPLDVYLKKIGHLLGDVYTVQANSEVFFRKNPVVASQSEYLKPGGELTVKNEYLESKRNLQHASGKE